MQYVWVILLFLPSALSQRFRVVVPEAPVSSVPGSDVVLSCSVRELDNRNIMVNAVDLTVTWSRSDLKDSLVHLYENHKDLNTGQNPSYRGRTAVFKEELKNGDVSLKLSNVRVSDEGEYRCRVDSTSWLSDKTIKLSVEGTHSPSLLQGWTHPEYTGRFRVVVPEAPVFSVPGSDVVLPCSVREFDNPNIMVNAVDLNVTWSRSDLRDSLVHLYENHKDLNTDQIPSYRGRTAVFKEELKNGDASLKLSNVRICDEGEYRCRVDSKNWEDSKTIKLSVEVVGSEPVITMEKYESGKFSLLCESKGWHPEPELQWRNSKGVNLTAETETQAVADLFNVKSRITVEEIDSFFCSVTQRHHEKEERIDAQSLHESESQ